MRVRACCSQTCYNLAKNFCTRPCNFIAKKHDTLLLSSSSPYPHQHKTGSAACAHPLQPTMQQSHNFPF